MDYIFVACESIIGSKVIKGPITGNEWLITPQGNWIADEFERTDKYLKLDIKRWCSRTRSLVDTKIYLVEPSFDQMESMPIGG